MLERIEKFTFNNIDVIKGDHHFRNDLVVTAVWDLPTDIAECYYGVAHCFEHMIFNDILDGVKGFLDLREIASNHGVDIIAYTAPDKIVIGCKVPSYFIPGADTASTESLGRFSQTRDGVDFLVKYIAGVVKEHAFIEEDLKIEKKIILAEAEQMLTNNRKLLYRLLGALKTSNVIGTAKEIKAITLETLNNFMDCLPAPRIVIGTNESIPDFRGIERRLENCINFSQLTGRNTNEFPTEGFTPMPEWANKERLGIKMDIRDARAEGFKSINGLAFCFPMTNSSDARDLEEEWLREISMGLITSVSTKGTIGSYLREEKGLVYSIIPFGQVNGDVNRGTFGYVTKLENINFNIDSQLEELMIHLDNRVQKMQAPSESDFYAEVRDHVATTGLSIHRKGCSNSVLSVAQKLGVDQEYIDTCADGRGEFDYRNFMDVYDEMLSVMTVVIL